MKDNLLTTREVSQILGMPEKDVINLANSNMLPHFKVAGEFLRFNRSDIVKAKRTIKKEFNILNDGKYGPEWIREFLYRYDFYLVCTIAIIALIWFIIKDMLS